MRIFDNLQLTKRDTIQPLWSGYGEITRYHSVTLNRPVIVKQVAPPVDVNHPRGWHGETSHQRKLSSYANEIRFYQHFAELCPPSCRVASCFAAHQASPEFTLVMEDLVDAGFVKLPKTLGVADMQPVLSWLAHFHARFLSENIEALWEVGCYWHLGTRQDEWQEMAEGALKQHAHCLDKQIRQARFQTLLHGDAKLANFNFTASLNDVAAVDFQYTGKGPGVRDLAYFVGSCLNSDELFTHHDYILDTYFAYLSSACREYAPGIDLVALEQEWRALYPVVWADFHRFLSGWKPDHVKINDYMKMQTDIALQGFKA